MQAEVKKKKKATAAQQRTVKPFYTLSEKKVQGKVQQGPKWDVRNTLSTAQTAALCFDVNLKTPMDYSNNPLFAVCCVSFKVKLAANECSQFPGGFQTSSLLRLPTGRTETEGCSELTDFNCLLRSLDH